MLKHVALLRFAGRIRAGDLLPAFLGTGMKTARVFPPRLTSFPTVMLGTIPPAFRHPATATRAPFKAPVIHRMALVIPGLAFPQVRPDLISVERVGRMMRRGGIPATTAGTFLPDTPCGNLGFAGRSSFPGPVLGLPNVDADPLGVGDGD